MPTVVLDTEPALAASGASTVSSDVSSTRALPWHWLDVALIFGSILFGVFSLTYPYGHDQGLYAYVATEWVERGRIPYRDVFDHKPPGIYILYALAVALFGTGMWGIRIFDLACVMTLGFIAARLLTPRDTKIAPGLRGLGCLMASVFHYGFFDYWSSAQTELYCVTFAMASICLVHRGRLRPATRVGAGLLAGAALIVKPTAAPFVAISAVLLALAEKNSWRRMIIAGLQFGAGALAIITVVFGYFGLHGALPAMYDIVVGANGYYVAHQKEVHSIAEAMFKLWDHYAVHCPLSAFMAAGWTFGFVRARRSRNASVRDDYLLAAALWFAGLAGVAIQQKFYWLHFVAMVGPSTVIALLMVRDLSPVLEKSAPSRNAVLRYAALFLLTYAAIPHPWGFQMWLKETRHGLAWATGKMDRDTYTDHFRMEWILFSLFDLDRTAEWLKKHSAPTDNVLSRGFNPLIYVLADRHYDGRFFWTPFLVDPRRAYRREAYLREDREAFERIRPRYVVAMSDVHEGLDSAEWYEDKGYRRRADFGMYTVLERP